MLQNDNPVGGNDLSNEGVAKLTGQSGALQQ